MIKERHESFCTAFPNNKISTTTVKRWFIEFNVFMLRGEISSNYNIIHTTSLLFVDEAQNLLSAPRKFRK